MFNFTTTTLINSSDKWLPKLTDELKIKFDHIHLKKANTLAIYHQAKVDAKVDEVSVTLPTGTANDNYRLKIYITLDDNNNSYYSNDMVYKGKPLYIEFAGDATVDTLSKMAKKYQLLVMEKPILEFGGSAKALTIKAVDPHQRISECVVEKFDNTKGAVAGVGNLGMYVTTSKGTITHGTVGRGTYEQILKNLRLPTAANTRFTSPNANEMPIPGESYDQYTVYYCVNRGIMGGDAVGETVKSRTCHVFFVAQSVKTAFETELKKIGTITESGTSVSEDAKPIPEDITTDAESKVSEEARVLDK